MKPSEALEKVPWIRGNMYSEECECHMDADMGLKSLSCTNGVCMLGAIHLTIPDRDYRLDFAVTVGRVMGWTDKKIEAVQIEEMITTYNDTKCPDKAKAVEVLKEAEGAFEELSGFDFEYREVFDGSQDL
jgi:hypothetical protein